MEERSAPAESIAAGRGGHFRILAPLLVIALIVGGLVAYYVYRQTIALVPPQSQKRDLAQEARDDLERRNFRPLSAPLAELLADPKYEPIATQAHTLLLQPAPDFTLLDVNGKEFSLAKELKGGPVVLVFYYGYHCNHCVSQLFALDKDLEKFRELGVQVVTISADPPELTRERFKQYGAFKFPVLSDPGNKVAEKYETYVASAKAGQEGDLMHGTFVISRQGKIVWTNRGDTPFTENRTLLHELARADGRLLAKYRSGK
jgi:peroxiredoxin Q/BCP